MNCTGDFRRNDYATFEASCLVYDAVLAIVGGSGEPRLNCSLPALGQLVERASGGERIRNHRPPTASARCAAIGRE